MPKTARQRSQGEEHDDEKPQKLRKVAVTVYEPPVAGEPPPLLPTLQSLLDLATTTKDELPDTFSGIAEALIHRSRLELRNGETVTTYQVLEAEFYLLDKEKHPDPFTHAENEQGVSGRWYFHRAPRRNKLVAPNAAPTGYRGGTRKGLDLTFGPPLTKSTTGGHSTKGGILLRTLRRESDKKVISGPSLLVDEIISTAGASTLKELVQVLWKDNTDAFGSIEGRNCTLTVVQHVGQPSKALPPIYTSPRVGLELSNPSNSDLRMAFVDRPYRYFVHPTLLVANGRSQTFAGLYRSLKTVTRLSVNGLIRKIATDTGLSDATVQKYAGFYQSGRKLSVELFVGPKGKGVCGTPEKYLAMLGALEKAKEL